MNEPKITNCPRCGAALATGAPEGICPRCAAGFLQATQTEMSGTEEGNRNFAPPSVAELSPLFPQLEILQLLGRGGMGAVYKAKQKELDRIVALKILPPAVGEAPAFAERFAREAKALARLNHPGIVTIHDFGRVNGLYYFLMEFVDGVNLLQLMEGGRISSREALAIVPQICDALQYAHDQGIVHRDIKPQNILLDRRGLVKVADFGLAKLVGQGETAPAAASGLSSSALTEVGKIVGTPAYMAPEQGERPTEVDHRADIYALGVVFYQLLTGELPGKPLERPSRKVQLDVRLDEVVLKAMEQAPERRYNQASQFKTAVEEIASPGRSSGEPHVEAATNPEAFVQGLASVGRASPRWWQVFLAGFSTVLLLEFGALALTERGVGAFVLALLAGGVAVAIFLIARKVWLNALLLGMAIAFFSWLAVVAAATVAIPLAAVAGILGMVVYWVAMTRLGVSRVFFVGLMCVFLLVFGASAIVTFIMPESFASTARIQIEAKSTVDSQLGARQLPTSYVPYLIQTEFAVMGSGAVLDKVIANLGLTQEWGRRYSQGRPLATAEALALLKSRLDLHPVRNTSLIEIRAFDEKADEAASIANEIAQVYRQVRESEIQSAGASSALAKVLIVDSAVPGLRPVRPNKPVNLAIGALAGLLLGTAAGAGLAVRRS